MSALLLLSRWAATVRARLVSMGGRHNHPALALSHFFVDGSVQVGLRVQQRVRQGSAVHRSGHFGPQLGGTSFQVCLGTFAHRIKPVVCYWILDHPWQNRRGLPSREPKKLSRCAAEHAGQLCGRQPSRLLSQTAAVEIKKCKWASGCTGSLEKVSADGSSRPQR